MSAATMTQRPTRRPRPIPAPSSGPPGRRRRRIGCGGGRSASVGSARPRSSSASSPSSSDPGSSGSRSSGSRSSGRLRGGVRLAARLRFAPAQLLQEVVEQVAHRPRSLVGIGLGPVEAFDGGPERGEDGLRELVGAHRRGPRGLEAERGADRRARSRHGRVGSSGGASVPRRSWSRPSSSRISPDSAPAIDGPRRASGGSGGGPAVGATSRKLTTPSSSATHTIASHQPSGASVGRDMPGAQPPVADADLVLAQERRTGRGEAFGHARRIAGRGPGPVRRASRPRSSAAASAVVGRGGSAVSAAAAAVVGGGRLPSRRPRRRRRRPRRSAAWRRAPLPRPSRWRRSRPHPGGRPCGPRAAASVCSATASAWRLAMSAAIWSFSISRLTAGSGGAMAPASAGETLSSGDSPPNHDSSRLRWRVGVLARMIASASMAVSPGSDCSVPVVRAALARRAALDVGARQHRGAPRADGGRRCRRRRSWTRSLLHASRGSRVGHGPSVRGAAPPL